mmetsp:Transcript_26474/g.77839  ORF Transcript_26474/g.77839 Transcript_26474/m.77839 type:complete len:766 (-) Transcript_26474:425-2722(-)
MTGAADKIRVIVRVRPALGSEQDSAQAVDITGDASLAITRGRSNHNASFDAVLGPDATQADVFERVRDMAAAVVDGYNATIFAYGQTGSGKTFTITGGAERYQDRGIIPRSISHIFAQASKAGAEALTTVQISYLEIYNEDIRDLLAKNATQKLELKENSDSGVYVKDLSTYVVKSVKECDKLREFGHKNRKTGATLMNADSSRSHAIFTVTVEQCETMPDGHASIRMGKLNMVDLAGSERQSKTGATGDRLKEATKINLSLSALGNCISALVDGKSSHIPYRDSKLTRLLQDSLGGNTKTVMIANMGPADYNYDESISTLRYANRAKNIQNKPKINEDPKDAMLREFQEEIQRLRDQLNAAGGGGGGGGVPGAPGQDRVVEREVVVEKVVGVSEEEVERIRRELEAQREKERQAHEAANQQQREEAQRAQAALLEQQARAEEEARRVQETEAKLKELEAKLIGSDGKNIIDAHAQQEEELKRARQELASRQEQEARIARELQERQDELLQREEKYSSLEEEVEAKTRKLKKLYQKYKGAQQEVNDLQEEFQREREDMLETVRELTRQLKLKALVIDNFIPPEEQSKIEQRAEWDEELEEWKVARLDMAGNRVEGEGRPQASRHARRPVSVHARIANMLGGANPRFRSENVLGLDLEMPERTTQDYEEVAVNPSIQQAIQDALDDSEELAVGGAENLPNMYFSYDPDGQSGGGGSRGGTKRRGSRKPKSGKARSPVDDLDGAVGAPTRTHAEELYPSARGLVPSR